MLLRCSDPGDEVHPVPVLGDAADLKGDVHPIFLLLGPSEWPYRGRAGEDKVALKVVGFDLALSNWAATIFDDFFKDAFSNKTSPFRRGLTQLEEATFSIFSAIRVVQPI